MQQKEIIQEIARQVEDYLKDFFEEERLRIYRDLCNCEPNLEKFLQIQARAKVLKDLEQQILIDKTGG